MAESKFLKAYCGKTNQYFGLEIKKFGFSWKVVNMIKLSDDEAKIISSEVEQSFFETNANLIPCLKCGNRRVGGCACAKKKHQCSKNMKYQFDCIYCDELKIDYTLPTASEVGSRAGGTVTLSQGQEVKIRYADDRPLSKISVGVGWDPASGANNMDVDSSVVVMSQSNREFELVYFGAKEHSSGCVIHHGDNLTGEGDIQSGDDENISVYLNKVPQQRDKLVFVLNIYKCDERGQTLDSVKNLYIKLYDPDSKKTLIQYRVSGNMSGHTALVIGMAFRKNGSWSFKAIGRSLNASDVQELARRCGDFV
ncbi:MAG: TerD family protein [Clostridia bacterium]|nr:TerD family protein [Clostridia bacterium]